jgi:hypothetical protein
MSIAIQEGRVSSSTLIQNAVEIAFYHAPLVRYS